MVEIKGQNNNLILHFGEGTGADFLMEMERKFSANPGFFKGMQVAFKGEGLKRLTVEEIASLQRLCLDHGMILQNSVRVKEVIPARSSGKDIIINSTLRSGQKVHSEGSVVIMGDVHESAEVVAGRDIIVLGKLEGIAHAGCYGDLTRIVFALTLFPRQIRIGDKVSLLGSDFVRSNTPEIAYWDGSGIAVREYPGKPASRRSRRPK